MSDMKLSERVRPDCEAAPWVIEEIKRLEAKLEALESGPDYGDGPEFAGWTERSAQQPQSAEAVAEVMTGCPGKLNWLVMPDFKNGTKLYTTPQPSAGVVMPEGVMDALDSAYLFFTAIRPRITSREVVKKLSDAIDAMNRLNGKEVGRG